MLTQFLFVIWLYIINSCNGLPAEYCNHPFNRSDCGGKPTPVFAYYKSGSRCEIETWKGCPTLNKFDTEVTCSFFCIARFLQSESSEEENEIPDEDSDSCEGSLNTDDCNKAPIKVFTHDPQEGCIEEKWWGCETSNKFSTKEACEEKCLPEKEKLSNIKVAEKIIEKLMNETEVVEQEVEETTKEPPAMATEPPVTEPPVTEPPTGDDAEEADSLRSKGKKKEG